MKLFLEIQDYWGKILLFYVQKSRMDTKENPKEVQVYNLSGTSNNSQRILENAAAWLEQRRNDIFY